MQVFRHIQDNTVLAFCTLLPSPGGRTHMYVFISLPWGHVKAEVPQIMCQTLDSHAGLKYNLTSSLKLLYQPVKGQQSS